eukprot:TRINITY_DN2088_c0_g3_i1.p1 TRINITY_DN2088_c0_g3~~TRINITY_DN2088_c0_g3_i1.p1  ORF type:complete len:472 (-),score=137.84 TRINITY_DN2088_c0_g3_i1:473-1888(-)
MSFWDRFKKKKEDKKEPKQTNTVLALKNKSPFAWTIEDVGNWLKYIGFPEYVTLFQENQIAGDVLFSLDIVDLKSMGVTVLGHRKKMMQEITTLVPDNKNKNNSEKDTDDSDSKESKESKDTSSKESSSKESITSNSSSKNINDPNYLKVLCIFDSEEVPFVCKKSYTFKKIQNKFEEAFGINGLRIYFNGKEIVEDKMWENIAQQNSEVKFEVKRGDPNQISNTEKNVLEQILDAAIVINIKGIILYGNRSIKKHLGYSRKTLVGKNINSIMPKEYSVKHDSFLEKYLQTGKASVIGKGRQVSIKLSSGEEKMCWLSVTENKTKHGRHTFTGTIHLLNDSRSQDMNSYKILDCLRKSIFVIDIDGLVQFVNRSAEQLLGYKTEELLGQNVNKIMPEPYSSRHNGYLQNYLKVGKSQIIGTKGRLVAAKANNGSLVPILLEVNEVIIDGKRFFVGVNPISFLFSFLFELIF